MDKTEKERILCIDDEPRVLQAYQRGLRKEFDLFIGHSAAEGLQAIKDLGEFAVIVTDQNMPHMDGVEFLKEVRQLAPNAVRVMLTGNSDAETAKGALNDGGVYKFLNKPCPVEEMREVLHESVSVYYERLVEKRVLEETLDGVIHLLCDLLQSWNSDVFAQNRVVKALAERMGKRYGVVDLWELGMAALLADIGTATLPFETNAKVRDGKRLEESEQTMLADVPSLSATLLSQIPRFHVISDIIKGLTVQGGQDDRIQLLKMCRTLVRDKYRQADLDMSCIRLAEIERCDVSLAREVRDELIEMLGEDVGTISNGNAVHCRVNELLPGMILINDLMLTNGQILITAGQEISNALLARVRSFDNIVGVVEPVIARKQKG